MVCWCCLGDDGVVPVVASWDKVAVVLSSVECDTLLRVCLLSSWRLRVAAGCDAVTEAAEHCAMRMMHSVAASAIVSVQFLAEPVRIGDAIHLPERLPRRRSLVDGSGGGGWERAQWYVTPPFLHVSRNELLVSRRDSTTF